MKDIDDAEKSIDQEEEAEEGEEGQGDDDVDNDDDEKDNGSRRTVTKNQENFYSECADKSAQPGEVWVQRSFKRGEYPLFRETRAQHSTPCMGCFIDQGPVWMLRGMGDKARKKTKGFKKITRRDLSLHTD